MDTSQKGMENMDPNHDIQDSGPGGLKRKREDIKPAPSGIATKPKVLTTKPLVGKTAPVVAKPTVSAAPKAPVARPAAKVTIPPPAKRTKIEVPAAAPAKSAAPAAPGAAKRPTWDMKGRLQDMESFTQKLQAQMNTITNQLAKKETELQTVSVAKESLQVDLSQYHKETEEMQTRIRELLRGIDEDGAKHRLEIDQLSAKLQSLQMRLDQVESQLHASRTECDRLRSSIMQSSEQLETVSRELASDREQLRLARDLGEDRAKKILELEKIVASQQESIDYMEKKSSSDEDIRRKLHNTIQELKGNIRVFCRLRPVLPAESEEKSVQYEFAPTDDTTIDIVSSEVKDLTGCKNAPEKRFSFKYDKVFSAESSQEEIFKETSSVVHAALEGYNSCIFAYGQTGSGKSYTMQGNDQDQSEGRGLICRAVDYLFANAYKLAEKGWEYEFHASYVEIFNESLQDLLRKQKAEDDKKYEIKYDATSGKIGVSGLTVTHIIAPEQIFELLELARRNQQETPGENRPARSNLVFRLHVVGKHRKLDQRMEGSLNLVELAGSERTQSPNKGLGALADVFAALANKEKQVPFKNSKLTLLLQDSLGGSAKALMLINIAPGARNLNETLNSLRFAQKVNACEIGSARGH